MQVTVEDVSSVKKVLHIEVPVETIHREIEKAYNTLQKTAKIKGFRPGKAPRSVLERTYKKDVEADVSSQLIQDSFVGALKKTGLDVLGSPRIDPPALDPDTPYAYDATVEIKPDIGEIAFKGLKLEKTVYPITDDMIDKQLEMLQTNLAQKIPLAKQRPVENSDWVCIDYEGFKNGAPVAAAAKTENATVQVGEGYISETFDQQLVGMSTGDSREITVTFPEDDDNRDLAGQAITYQVVLKDILVEERPAIDDEFAKKLGKFDSLDTLKAEIRSNLSQGYDKRAEQELHERSFEALLAKTDFEVPEVLVAYELENIIADAERSFAQHNMSLESVGLSKNDLRVKYKDTAEKQARRHLILARIIEQEALALTDDELDEGIREMAEAYHQPFEGFKNYFMSQPDKLAYFKEALLEKKAMKLIIDHATIDEKEAAPEASGAEAHAE